VHRLGAKLQMGGGLALSALGLLVLTRLSEGTSYLWILLSLTLVESATVSRSCR